MPELIRDQLDTAKARLNGGEAGTLSVSNPSQIYLPDMTLQALLQSLTAHQKVTLEQDLVVKGDSKHDNRDYGGKAASNGRYWSLEPSKGSLQSQLDSAVLPEWGNTFQHQAVIKVPKGTKYYEGPAAAQKGTVGTLPELHGGGIQVFLPKPNKDWILK